MLRWPALSKGLVLRAFGIRGRRGRRPMFSCAFLLSFDLAKDKGWPNSRRGVPSIRRRAKSAHLVARDAGSLKWSTMRSRRPWSLGVRAALSRVFAIARPAGSSAMCQPAGSWMTSDS
jgi:hypothetical protein